ncbi:MAG: GIY-YIG nuclease family protein [Candidatus Sungbacteria bacterium]|nr:GIY-YIG nuclease family protein [Candidatus Sungbacteria bacterium]
MQTIKDRSQKAPHTPGVYIFRTGKTAVYVGKAADIYKRLSSYFRKNVSAKTRQMVAEATSLEWIETPSEIEALIKEAEMIKAHLPKFNLALRDDKNYFYVAVTCEQFPRIFLTHQLQRNRIGRIKLNKGVGANYIGPFTSGPALKEVLALLRRAFPYCTCTQLHKRPCLNSQIEKCLGFCCIDTKHIIQDTNHKEYGENIKNIVAILTGKKKKLLIEFKRQMREAAKKQDFEKAALFRNQMVSIENIFGHRPLTHRRYVHQRHGRDWQKIERVIKTLLVTASPISRVEGYDISNISGTEATGSMVVFINGKPEKSAYRMFRIKTVDQPNDVAMHREVMARRLAHVKDWGAPDLLVIDGGKPQLNAIRSVLRPGHETIRLAALAKREEELFIEGKNTPQRLDSLPPDVKLFFQHVRDESHRFAKKYHHKLRKMIYRAHHSNTSAL